MPGSSGIVVVILCAQHADAGRAVRERRQLILVGIVHISQGHVIRQLVIWRWKATVDQESNTVKVGAGNLGVAEATNKEQP